MTSRSNWFIALGAKTDGNLYSCPFQHCTKKLPMTDLVEHFKAVIADKGHAIAGILC